MNFRQKAVLFLGTGCFIGNVSFAPGTFGSILGLPLCFFLSKIDLTTAVIITAALIFFSVWIAHEAEKILKKKDPGAIVIDEIAGIVVTFIGLPFNWFLVAAGFVIFRLLDIFKPYPIDLLEKKMSGGAGIVFDDVAAGVCSNLLLRGLCLVFGISCLAT